MMCCVCMKMLTTDIIKTKRKKEEIIETYETEANLFRFCNLTKDIIIIIIKILSINESPHILHFGLRIGLYDTDGYFGFFRNSCFAQNAPLKLCLWLEISLTMDMQSHPQPNTK